MMGWFDQFDPESARAFRGYTRCLPFADDCAGRGSNDDSDNAAFYRMYKEVYGEGPFGEESPADLDSLRCRSLRSALSLKEACRLAWKGAVDPAKKFTTIGDRQPQTRGRGGQGRQGGQGEQGGEGPPMTGFAHGPGAIDCLFALERLSAPYCNIRGHDLSMHTEPIDCLWPVVETASACAASAQALDQFYCEHGISADTTQKLRAIAGVADDTLTLGIGDGGNEVGMGTLVHLPGISQLKPIGGGGTFAELSVNGSFRGCNHVLLGTVSNWGGSAFEMAVDVFLGPPSSATDCHQHDYLGAMVRSGRTIAHLEEHVLRAIMVASPGGPCAVDGKDYNKEHSVDGMPFAPHHKSVYDLLWKLSGREL